MSTITKTRRDARRTQRAETLRRKEVRTIKYGDLKRARREAK